MCLPTKDIPNFSATRKDALFSGLILQQTVSKFKSPKAYSKQARAASIP